MTEVEPATRRRRPPRSGLEQARVAVPLIRALALRADTLTELGRQYGVSHQAVLAFRKRHQQEVDAAREDINAELAGLWIANKRARLETLQNDVEAIEDNLSALEWDQWPAFLRTKHAALELAGKEVGAYRMAVDVSTVVRHEIVGIDVEVLR